MKRSIKTGAHVPRAFDKSIGASHKDVVLNKARERALRVAVKQLQSARDNLLFALGPVPVGWEDEHPLCSTEVALHYADCALDDPSRYYCVGFRSKK